jgi:hypothetical protein
MINTRYNKIKNSGLMAHAAVSFTEPFPMFRRNVVPLFSRVKKSQTIWNLAYQYKHKSAQY